MDCSGVEHGDRKLKGRYDGLQWSGGKSTVLLVVLLLYQNTKSECFSFPRLGGRCWSLFSPLFPLDHFIFILFLTVISCGIFRFKIK